MTKPRLLICIDWFDPAFRAGGPIRSVANLVQALSPEMDIRILTSDNDRGTPDPLPVVTDTWISWKGHAQVMYQSKESRNRNFFRKILEALQPDCIYCNSMFSESYTRIPLQEARKFPAIRRVLAVRGMLKPEALASKRWKKLPYLSLFRLLRLHTGVMFHATSEEEAREIRVHFGSSADIQVVPNLPASTQHPASLPEKQSGELRLVSISRILPHKNILQMIRLLGKSGKPSLFDIYGPIEHPEYWTQCLQAISTLPQGVEVRYCGSVPPDAVTDTLDRYHALFSLSESENFGHTIIESLQAGRLVIIGSRTPWKKLEENHAGFDIPLDQTERILKALDQIREMNTSEYKIWSIGARKYAQQHLLAPDTIGRYRELFSGSPENRP